MVTAMSNKRAQMKVWPLVIVCYATGAIQLLVMHDYSTSAFLLQWEFLVALRGHPKLVRSDRGSHNNYVGRDQRDWSQEWN